MLAAAYIWNDDWKGALVSQRPVKQYRVDGVCISKIIRTLMATSLDRTASRASSNSIISLLSISALTKLVDNFFGRDMPDNVLKVVLRWNHRINLANNQAE